MPVRPALFGKCPALGDFVARDMDHAIEESWRDWMQQGLSAHVRGSLDAERAFLRGATWAFAARANVFGKLPLAGVTMPSKDAEGRCFPLSFFGVFEDGEEPVTTAAANIGWYRQARAQLLAQFDAMPGFLGMHATDWACDTSARYAQTFDLDANDPNYTLMVAFLDNALDDVISIWWTLDDDDPPQAVVIQTGPSDDELWQRLFLSNPAWLHPQGTNHAAV